MPISNKASVATLIIFLKCFVPFAITMGLISMIDGSEPANWPPDLVNVLPMMIAAVVFASIMTMLQVGQVRRLGAEPRLWGSVRHDRTVALSLSCEETIRLVDWAARSWRWKVRSVEADARKITVATRMSWQSWGERVTVTARPMGTGCGVEVSSRPWVPLTLIDSGRNFVNVQRMIAFLTEHPAGPAGDLPVDMPGSADGLP
jgi:hypothetical protein